MKYQNSPLEGLSSPVIQLLSLSNGEEMSLLKTVFHIHSHYSDDSDLSIPQLADLAKRSGTQCLAITDHDTLAGARALAAYAKSELKVIIGQEISTRDGHLIGLFLREPVKVGMTARETAKAIRQQDGLVVAPHPFNFIFGCSLREKVFDILDLIDIIEICNAQNLLPMADLQAEALAQKLNYPVIVGADLHHGRNIDPCYQCLEPFDGPQSFLSSLKKAHFVKGRHTLGYFVEAAWIILRSKSGWGLPQRFGQNCHHERPVFKPTPIHIPTK